MIAVKLRAKSAFMVPPIYLPRFCSVKRARESCNPHARAVVVEQSFVCMLEVSSAISRVSPQDSRVNGNQVWSQGSAVYMAIIDDSMA